MPLKTLTIERAYEVTFSSEIPEGVTLALHVLSLPISSHTTFANVRHTHPYEAAFDIGFLDVIVTRYGDQLKRPHPQHLVNSIRQVVDSQLHHYFGHTEYSDFYKTFVAAVLDETFIPIEASPLSGASLSELAKDSSLIGFATFGESYGLMHHDAVVIMVTPICVLLIGATVGAGEGLRERIKTFLLTVGSTQPRK